MSRILLINGPNLNLLGSREPGIYGSATLAEIVSTLTQMATQASVQFEHFQSNAEHVLIEKIQSVRDQCDYIIINPAAFTHTSIAIRDALLSSEIPFIEIHLSNPYRREHFRQHSYFSDIAQGVIVGFGGQGYEMAMGAALNYLKAK